MKRRHILAMTSSLLPIWPALASSAQGTWRRDRVWAAGLSSPVGMAIDRAGRLFVANWSAGTVTVTATNGSTAPLAAGLNGPSGLALASNGDLFVASYSGNLVWRILPSGQKEVFVQGLGTPAGLSFDNQGRLLIANRATHQILAADTAGKLTVAVEGKLQTPVGAVQLASGGYAVSNIDGGVAFAGRDGQVQTVSRELARPGPGIAVADESSVYVVDYGGTEVKQVYIDGRTRVVAEGFKSPAGLALSTDGGTAVVADWGTNTAYRLKVTGD